MSNHRQGVLDRWACAIDNMKSPAFWITFLVTFIVMFCSFWFGFICHGKGFIWTIDGLEEQYMFFIQEGQWLRELVGNIFSAEPFEIPMWSSQIGYGGDYVYSVLFTLGNPINLVSFFAYPENADIILEATVPFTLLLSSLSFLWYCSYKKFDAHASLLGSMVYTFGGYSFIAYTQIYMLYPLVLAPLALRGVDRIFDGKSPLGFIVAMALACLNGVYTGYTISLLLFVYCVVKFFFLPGKKGVLVFLKWFGIIFGCIIVGAMISCVLLLPLATSILGQGRLGVTRIVDLFYSIGYYASLFQGFISMTEVGADCIIGFASIALICVAHMIGRRKNWESDDRQLFILFVIFTIVLLLPIAGRITNGFAYATNRWVYGYALLVALIVTIEFPKLIAADEETKRKTFVVIVVYALVCLACSFYNGSYLFYLGFAGLVLAIAFLIAFATKPGALKASMLFSVAVCCLLVSFPLGIMVAEQKIDFGKSYEVSAVNDPASLVASIDGTDETTRYDIGAGGWSWRNGNWALGLSGSTFYNSLYNNYVDEYHTSLGLSSAQFNFSYCTLNARTALEALGGVQYYVSKADTTLLIPPTYDEVANEGTVADIDFTVYTTDKVVPLAYVEGDIVERAAYDDLGMVDRQDVMLQALVLENGLSSGYVAKDHTTELPYSIELSAPGTATLDIMNTSKDADDADVFIDGSAKGTASYAVKDNLSQNEKESSVVINDGSILIREPETVLYFDVDIPEKTEAYFCVYGLDYTWLSKKDLISGDEWSEMSAFSRLKTDIKSLLESAPAEVYLYVYSDGVKSEIRQMNGRSHLYGGKDSWAVNLGYCDEPRNTVVIEFKTPGLYAFKSIEIVAEDSKELVNDIQKLTKQAAQNISYSGNHITCDVNNAKNGDYLALRVPYASGWTAMVNGESVEIVRSNVGFMAIPLPEGNSSIELSYTMPYLKLGGIVSIIGIVLTIVIALLFKRSNSNK